MSSVNNSILNKIASETGGEYYEAKKADELLGIYAEFGFGDDFDKTDTDGDGLYDAVEVAGIRLQNGDVLYGCDPSNPDTDDDGLKDGEEIETRPQYSNRTIYNDDGTINTVEGYYFVMKSDPTKEDTDGDKLKDNVDEYPMDFKVMYSLGSDKYIENLNKRLEPKYDEALHTSHDYFAECAKYRIEYMMNDYYEYSQCYEVSDIIFDDWDNFCDWFKSSVDSYSNTYKITKEIHYFRNKLNRAPETLSDLLLESDKWALCAAANSIYHMNGQDGVYNLKFISNCGKYEAVYNKYGDLLTEYNDPINMGTFNYAKYIPHPLKHLKLDVSPYETYGNTPDTTASKIDYSTYDNNSKAKEYHKSINELINSDYNGDRKIEEYQNILDNILE